MADSFVMPELLTRRIECVIGRSASGVAVVTFEDEAKARKWLSMMPNHRIRLYRQTIIEEEVQL